MKTKPAEQTVEAVIVEQPKADDQATAKRKKHRRRVRAVRSLLFRLIALAAVLYVLMHDDGIYRYFDILYHDWDELCLGELEVSPIPGNHLTCLSNPEYVKVVADKLNYKNLAR